MASSFSIDDRQSHTTMSLVDVLKDRALVLKLLKRHRDLNQSAEIQEFYDAVIGTARAREAIGMITYSVSWQSKPSNPRRISETYISKNLINSAV